MVRFVPIDSMKSDGIPKGRDFSGVMSEIERIRSVFADVYPRTIDQWVHSFDCDENPEYEIATWSAMADVFERARVKIPEKKTGEILAALLLYTSGAHTVEELKEYSVQCGRPINLTDSELGIVIDTWKTLGEENR